MSHKNLIKKMNIVENASNITTALNVYGEGDMTIATINPLGTPTLYDFSYYANTSWMTQGLVDAINAWTEKCNGAKDTFMVYKNELRLLNSQLITLESEKTTLETDLASLEAKHALASTNGDNATCTAVSAQIEAKKIEITNKTNSITGKKKEIENKESQIAGVNTMLSFENNFTDSQYKELSYFIYEADITNTDFATTDETTYEEEQGIIDQLFEYGKNKLSQVSQPTFECEIDSINFLNLIEYKKAIDEFDLGVEITIAVNPKKDLFAKMILLGYEMDLDDRTKLNLKFSNKLNYKSINFTYEDLFNKTSSISKAFDTESKAWGKGEKAYDNFNEYKNNALNLINQDIISSDNQEILINANGIRGREWIDETQTYSGEQFWMNKNKLVYSDDGFKTTKAALGKIYLPDGTEAYGLIGDALVGNIVYTKYLTCENESGSFKVDGSNVIIKNGTIIMESGDTLEESLENVQNKASGDLADAIVDINNSLSDMQQSLRDEMIVTYYQPTQPSGGKRGDVWFNTSDGLAYRYNGVSWQTIQDKDVIKALADAATAQETADGKITTFYYNGFPTKTSHPTLDEGDLLIHIGMGNRQYRYDGKTWINIQDTAINAISEELGEQVNAINTAMGNMQSAIEDGMIDIFYQGTQPTSAKTGDIWYDTKNKNKAYLYQNNQWVSIQDQNVLEALNKAQNAQTTADGKIKTYHQNTEPTGLESKDYGDLWFDTDDGNKLYRWDGAKWVSVRDESISKVSTDLANAVIDINSAIETVKSDIVTTYYQDTQPTNAKVGDVWYNTSIKNVNGIEVNSDEVRKYNGTSWILIKDSSVVEAIKNAQNAQTTADGKIRTFYTNIVPKDADEGDLWINPNNNNLMKIYTNNTWVEIRDGLIDKVSEDLEQAIKDAISGIDFEEAIKDSVIETFFQENEPTSPSIGDIWFNTSNGLVQRYSGNTWESVEDPKISQALEETSKLEAVLDGKISSFYQDDEPTKAQSNLGDLWIDTNDGNKLYRYDGDKWISIQDSSIEKVSKDLNQVIQDVVEDLQSAINDGMIETFFGEEEPANAKLGDIWFDGTTGMVKRYNGMTWENVEDPRIQEALKTASKAEESLDGKITSYYCDNAPYVANDGDLWIDTNDGNKLYRYSMTSLLSDLDNNSLEDMDNHTLDRLDRYGSWVNVQDKTISDLAEQSEGFANAIDSITNDISDLQLAIEDGVIETFYSKTTPENPSYGDLWFDTGKNKLKRYNGVSWDEIHDQTAIDAVQAAQDAQETADGKIRTFYQTSQPSMVLGKDIGDLWIDTDDGNKLYRWDGASWIDIHDKTIDKVSDSLTDAIISINKDMENMQLAIEDGEMTIWYQDNEPENAKAGDIWYDTSNKNKAWLAISGGIPELVSENLLCGTFVVAKDIDWLPLQDETVLDALNAAQNAQTTADGKIKTYYQPNMPTNGSNGDLWFDTDDKNKPYRHNGITFIEIQDGAIKDVQDKVEEVTNTITGVINSNGTINTDKLVGSIQAGSNNILLGSSTNRMVLNDSGILITNNNGASWDTAISADGIVADLIQSGGTISGVTFKSVGENTTMELSSGKIKFEDASRNAGFYTSTDIILFSGSKYLSMEAYESTSLGTGATIRSGQSLVLGSTMYSNAMIINQNGDIEFNSFKTGGYMGVGMDFWVSGEKDSIVPTQHYGVRTLYCEEADRAYFLTNGTSETIDGECTITLDPIFTETIELNSSYPYIIQLTSYSDAHVWVEQIDDYSFKVKSDKDTKFAYSLRAIRISFGNKYLEEKKDILDKKQLKQVQEAAVNRMK